MYCDKMVLVVNNCSNESIKTNMKKNKNSKCSNDPYSPYIGLLDFFVVFSFT